MVEDKIKKAYHELHQRKVLHGDVHPGNILVSPDKSVFIVDFEFSRTAVESKFLESEMSQVTKLLEQMNRD